ncbi:hypothetical protein [Kitasatospora sp. DSM 101779]|uniref:hypothetical protein n=1 Tax=Kitasatospora sp. DSM 101779 TaxID=2853165 RepID=UPI0021DA8659|nr:hypothetical protein [Kitasatospora sp. DSM 101779]MCU7821053.1 hypothetical protein [Kitasatospora sp. DSM 101779]
MSGSSSFKIDLEEVEAATKAIRAMLDDLEAPTARLEAVINQIKPTAYGSEAVGKSLTGGTSSVGGLPEHQKQVFDGVKAYLQNSAQMAANLELMVQRYRETEATQVAELSQLNGGRGGEAGPLATPVSTTAPLTAPSGTRVSPLTAVDGMPATEPLRAVDGMPVSEPLRAVDGMPATEPLRVVDGIRPPEPVTLPTHHAPDPAFHTPDAPDLSYNSHADDDVDPPPLHGGGRNMLI